MDEATLFKFDECVDYGKSHTSGKDSARNGCGLGHVIVFEILNHLQYFPECLNLASGSATASLTLKVKNFPQKGAKSRSRDRFRNEATPFKFRKWRVSHAPLKFRKMRAETGVLSVWPLLKFYFWRDEVGRWGKRGRAGYLASQDS